MDLNQWVIDLVSLVNSIVIPFILGIAFLVFIINVIRYFVIGGANQEAQEKARATATYGILAFVFILVFWGIVNVLTSGLGLQQFGVSQSRCSDYVCPDGNTPSGEFADVGGDFGGAGIGDPRPADLGGSPGAGFPDSPSPDALPGSPISPAPPTPGGPDSLPTPSPSPTPPDVDSGTTDGDYSDITYGAEFTVEDTLPAVESSFLSSELSELTTPGMRDESRLQRARSFADAGLISDTELTSIINSVNTVRLSEELGPIAASSVAGDPAYTAALVDYTENVEQAVDIINTWYGEGITAQVTIDSLFNTEDYSYEERLEAAEETLGIIRGPNPDVNAAIQSSITGALEIEQEIQTLNL